MNFKYIAFILGIILLGSCQDNLTGNKGLGKTVLIPLYVSTPDIHSSHTVAEAKDAIRSLHILVFAGNTTGLEQASLIYTVKATMQQGNNFVASFLKSQNAQDLYRLVLLANVDDTKVEQLTKGNTYNQISESLYEDAQQRYSPDAPVKMFGVVNQGNAVQITENMSLGTISLIRAVARIDIGVGTYNEESGKWDLTSSDTYFELTDVEAWSPMSRIFNMPAGEKFGYEANGIPLVSSATGSLNYSATKSVRWKYTGADILNNNTATYCKDVIYLPEAPLQGYTANQAEDRDKRTTLIIGGYLHDTANPSLSGIKTWYRVDFTEASGNTPDGPLFDLLRNHLYRFSLSVKTRGAASAAEAWNIPLKPGEISMEIAAWEDGGIVETPTDPTILIDQEHSTIPDGVSITDNNVNVSRAGGEIVLAFSAESAVEMAEVVNPSFGRLQIQQQGASEVVEDKIITRFNIKVKQQGLGHEGYAVEINIKSPLQQLSHSQYTINVQPSDKQFPVATLGGRTWMAFNSNGKGNDVQLYLNPDVTVQQMYENRWGETLGLQFQFGVNKGYIPWIKPDGKGGSGGTPWNNKTDGAPCPEGYRVPTFSELKALFPKKNISLGSQETYAYNDDIITATLKQGNPATITFPQTSIKGYTYYITLTSQKTGDVLYIPFGGWKQRGATADPKTMDGVYYWANESGKHYGATKQKNVLEWMFTERDIAPSDYAYIRCIKNIEQ